MQKLQKDGNQGRDDSKWNWGVTYRCKKHRNIPSCKNFFKPLWSTIAQEDDEDEFLFFKKAIPGLFSFIFIFSRVNSKSVFCLKFYWWLASNRRPLASEVTALPTEPHRCPKEEFLNFCHRNFYCNRFIKRQSECDGTEGCAVATGATSWPLNEAPQEAVEQLLPQRRRR